MHLNRENLACYVKLLGTSFVFFALGIVGTKIHANWTALRGWGSAISLGWIVLGGAFVYALTSLLLSVAWIRGLCIFGHPEVDSLTCHGIYARSQIAKYIPGNVFHFATRHAFGNQAGVSHGALIGAAFFEAAGLVGSACALSLLGFFLSTSNPSRDTAWYVSGFVLALLVPFATNLVLSNVRLFRNLNIPVPKSTRLFKEFFPSFFIYLLFFTFSGAILVWLLYLIDAFENIRNVGLLLSIYAISWVAGFVTPGAPAGIGIREAVMVVWLGPLVGEAEAILVALVFRFITLAGDLLFFLSSFLCKGKAGFI